MATQRIVTEARLAAIDLAVKGNPDITETNITTAEVPVSKTFNHKLVALSSLQV